jgi:hypothetical protein
MPVQINEVIIRTVVDPAASEDGSKNVTGCGNADNAGDGLTGAAGPDELAEKIFEIIREKQER